MADHLRSRQFKASESFKDEAVADAWRTAVTTALAEGRTPPSGEHWRRSSSRTSLTPRTLSDEQRQRTPLAVVFESLCRTRYEDRRQGGAQRLDTVRSQWSNHLLPFLERQIGTEPCIQDVIFEVAHAFPLWLAGRHAGTEAVGGDAAAEPDLWLAGGQELTGAQAAAQAGISTSQLNARRRAGKLLATQQADGTWRYTHQGLRDAGLLGHVERGSGLSKDYAREILTVLKMVLEHARALGAQDVPDVKTVLVAVEPFEAHRLNEERIGGRTSELPEIRQVAAQMHVIWQLVLWMLRLLGLRIGEAFGPLVGDFVDLGDIALLVVERQGGRAFLTYDDSGQRVVANTKGLKTGQSVRVLPLPAALAALIRVIIAAFHTDETGAIDLQARLVPVLRSSNGGQQGFRSAFKAAARAVGLDGVNPYPHSMRADLITDLHDLTEIQGWVTRRYAGHLAGADVHARHYQRDHPQMKKLREVAHQPAAGHR